MDIFIGLFLSYICIVYLIPATLIAMAELLDELVRVVAPLALWIAIVNIFAQPKSLMAWTSFWGIVTLWRAGLKPAVLKLMNSVRSSAQAVVMPFMFGISAFVAIGAPGSAINGRAISNGPLGSRKEVQTSEQWI